MSPFKCQWCDSHNLEMRGNDLVCLDCKKTCWHGSSMFGSIGGKSK